MTPEEFEKELIAALMRPEEWEERRPGDIIQHRSGVYFERYDGCRDNVPQVRFYLPKPKHAPVVVAKVARPTVDAALMLFDEHLRKKELENLKREREELLTNFGGFR